ncbi:MAG: hypothetical protein JWL97_3411 [Gemmatimonadales bacterium]|nr:hypothetical protein [Gemmatimonadales bacterium]
MTDNARTITLSKPLTTHDGEVTTLKLKEPEARLFFKHGEGFKMKVTRDEQTEAVSVDFEFNNAVFGKYLADMTGLDDIVLGKLRAADYMHLRTQAAHLIVGLTGENPSET